MMNEEIKKLNTLQEIDTVIDGYQSELKKLPQEIENKKLLAQQLKAQLEEEKKQLQTIQLHKKEKELELGSQEEKNRKHEMELNTIKSNESYKTMLHEIENGKKNITHIEDEILNFMEEIENFAKNQKTRENEAKEKEQEFQKEIQKIEEQIKKTQAHMDVELAKRQECASLVSPSFLSRYNYIREKKKGIALAPIKGDFCGRCNTALTQSAINEVRKGKEIIVCESCSVILYIPETPISSSAPIPS